MDILHTIYPLSHDPLSDFLLTPFPPLLVHLVIECPPSVCMSSYSCYMHVLLHLILDQRNDFKVGGTQKISKYCHIIAAGPLGSGGVHLVHCGLAGVSCGVHWEFVGGPFGSVKFIYCEKATKFCEISTNYLTGST